MTETLPRRVRAVSWLDTHALSIAQAAVAFSLLATVAYAIVLGDTVRYLDEEVYLRLTESLATGVGFSADGWQATAYRPPGYSFLLVPLHWIGGGTVVAMRFAGIFALAGSVWLLYRLGKRANSPAAGAVAAVILAVYPLSIYTATALYPQIPALFLLLATMESTACAVQAVEARRKLVPVLLAGLSGGLLVLTVPNFLPSVVLIALWFGWRHKRVAALVLAAAAVLPIAWCVRNAVQFDAFVPVSTNNGINLLLGNSEHATGSSGTSVDISRYESEAVEQQLDEVGINNHFSDRAVDWITENPGDAALLYVEKVVNNFAFSNDMATGGQGAGAADLVLAFTFYPLLGLALWRVVSARRRLSRVEVLAGVLIVVNVLLLAVFFTRVRFRVPLDALMILLAATAITTTLRGRDDRAA